MDIDPIGYTAQIESVEFVFIDAYPFPSVPRAIEVIYHVPALPGMRLPVVYDLLGEPSSVIDRIINPPTH